MDDLCRCNKHITYLDLDYRFYIRSDNKCFADFDSSSCSASHYWGSNVKGTYFTVGTIPPQCRSCHKLTFTLEQIQCFKHIIQYSNQPRRDCYTYAIHLFPGIQYLYSDPRAIIR